MLLASALFALFTGGFWLYCLTDAILTPGSECRGMPKPAWIAIITATFAVGALAWLIARQPGRATVRAEASRVPRDQRWTEADDALARHPAGRFRSKDPASPPKGPDDDPEFLRTLDRAIRGSYEPGEES